MGQLFKITHPEIFQGNLQKNFYFEGWYFKLVDKDAKQTSAFICGIALNRKANTSHCFVQYFDGITEKAWYFKYPVDQFSYSETAFEVKIGPNLFSTRKMHIDINQDNTTIKGDLELDNITPSMKLAVGYGVMGAAAYVPFLEGRLGIISMDHTITGSISVNNNAIDFTGGQGYTEKDWGSSFPKAYIWMQTNHFSKPGCSFMSAIATIPMFGIDFTGPLAVFMFDGKMWRFGPDNFSRLKIHEIGEDLLICTIGNPKYELKIEGHKKGGVWLPSPTQGDMSSKIQESLTATIKITFSKKKGKQREVLFEDTGKNAGLEIMANLQSLNAKK